MKSPLWFFSTRWFAIVLVIMLPTMVFVLSEEPTEPPVAAASQQITSQFGHTFMIQQEIAFPVTFSHIFQVVHAPGQNRLYVTGDSSYLFVVDLATSTASLLPNMPAVISWVAVSSDGQRLYVNSNGNSVRIYNTSNWNSFLTINDSLGQLTEADGRLFALSSTNLKVFNSITGAHIETFNIPGGNSYSGLVVSPDHHHLYLHGATTLHKLDITTTPITQLLSAPVGTALGDLSISPDGTQLTLTQYPSDSLYRFSSSNFALIDILPGLANEFVKSTAYTDDLLVGFYGFANDGPTLRGFDPATGEDTHHFGMRNYVTANNIQINIADIEPMDNGRLAMSIRANSWPKVWIMAPTNYGVALPLVMRDYCIGPWRDNFSDPNSGWPRGSSGNITYNYVNNEYQIFQGTTDQWFAVSRGDYFGQDDSDQYMEIDTRILDGQDGTIGIVWGLNGDWSDFYTFELWPNEQYWLVFHFNSATGWQLLSYQFSSFINRTGTNKISMYGDNINSYQFQINDMYAVEQPVVMGRVGLSAGSFDNNMTFRYDNYVFQFEGCHPVSPRLPINISTLDNMEQHNHLVRQAIVP